MDSGRPSNPRRIGARVIGASARVGIALAGLTLVILDTQLHPYPTAAAIGMGLVLVSALIQLSSGRTRVLQGEEIIAAAGGILLIGLGDEQITVLTLLWLAAVVTGAMVRGRVSKLASVMFAIAMVMPLVRAGELHADYVGLCVAAAALLLSGRAVMDEMSELLERARYEADHDGLTGALARTAFHAALEQAIAETPADQPLALLALDIDGFRRVNKAHGHAAGDALLKSTVNHLRTFGGETAVVGRLGGDEFSVIVTQQESHQFAQQILDSLAIGDEKTHGTLGSIGIAHAPTDGNDASALMRASDIALRVAKRSGPGQICLYAGESLSGDGESDAEAMLTRLISGEGIEMFVQPLIDIASGTVHGYEALARFQLGTTTSPLHWFALADEFGRREELEQACLREAAKLMPALPDGALLSVNVSGPVLARPQTFEILNAFEKPSQLIIEITEDTLISNDNAPLNTSIAILRTRGVKFAIDDMGAGYAGLRQITAVHPDYLKLDRSLVSEIQNDPDRLALVSAMVDYANRVGAMLVAEGIETSEEYTVVTALGVHLAQGFLLARPAAPWPSHADEAAISQTAKTSQTSTPPPGATTIVTTNQTAPASMRRVA